MSAKRNFPASAVRLKKEGRFLKRAVSQLYVACWRFKPEQKGYDLMSKQEENLRCG
jgi:hypothetical protein